MTQEIKYFCDVCTKEFPPNKTYAFLTGQMLKIDKELQEHCLPFQGHYCSDCTELIIKQVDNLKREKGGTNNKAELGGEGDSGSE